MRAIALVLAAVGGGLGWAEEVRYGVGSWPEAGRGNHRALVRVEQPAEAVWAHIEWRRRDREPEKKDIRVYDAATGQRVTNVVPATVTREAGDIVFQPATVPGNYEVYYLPYNPGTGNFDDAGTYFAREDTADAPWRTRNGLTAEKLVAGAWRALPRAQLVEIQARGEFHRMDPMEVIATEAETAELLGRYPNRAYLPFPEDRKYPIRMSDDLPLKWTKQGPSDVFRGEAQPGEYYAFQIGVCAARKPIKDLAIRFTDLAGEGGKAIPGSALTCFNLGGTDWLRRPMKRTFDVAEGQVRALWMGVDLPSDASGTYRGEVRVRPEGDEESVVKVELKVAGPALADRGDSELWRMARLRWLNSTLGIDDEVIPPFTRLEVKGDVIRCLGREVRFGSTGLLESITSNGRSILAAPMELVIESAAGRARWAASQTRTTKLTPGKVERQTSSQADGLALTVQSRMEFDGCVTFRATAKAQREMTVRDIRLELPLRRDVAPYMMGMGKRGGYRPAEWDWKWDIERANEMVWLGDADAGLQLKLMGPKDVWEGVTLRDVGLPDSWSNGGRGGCTIYEAGDRVLVRAFSGERRLKAGEEIALRFRLLITPFKPIDQRHWNWRYGDPNGEGNILHIHHGCPDHPYINYPFLTVDRLKATVQAVKALKYRTVDFGGLTYPAPGQINPERGTLHVWATVNFDPHAGGAGQAQYNQGLFHLGFPNEDELGFYWNIDDRGLRVYVRKGAPSQNQYPILFGTHSPDWNQGDRHLLSLSWGERLAVFVDGKLLGAAPYRGILPDSLGGATLHFSGGFVLGAVKITDEPYEEGAAAAPAVDEHTLLCDTFSAVGQSETRPEKGAAGKLEGVIETTPDESGQAITFSSRRVETPPKGVNVYYTVGQISNHVVEMWPLRSLGDEVFVTRSTTVTKVGDTLFGLEGGGYPWLKEHLVSGYLPAWRQPLWEGDHDAAISQQPLSRWHNYYVEGLQWLMRNTGIDGLYLDGIGYDREIMKRVAKVMSRNSPDYRINFHSGDCWSPPWDPDRRVSPANHDLEHFPYLSNLWFGELYDYNLPPDYWLVEISGIPFGLTGEMLNYETGGNPYRGMVYGMTSRQHPSAPGMWRFWDEFGIQDAEMLGYWSPKCPVRTNREDVLATVYRRPGKALIALGHWPGQRPRPEAITGSVTAAPSVDGVLQPGEWDQAARLASLMVLGTDQFADPQTEAFAARDGERLYLAFRCAHAGGGLRAATTARDGMVWEDDAIEFFIQPDPGQAAYYQFIGNSRGVLADGRSMDMKWNGDWTYRASVHEGYWEGEISIPFASLGMKPPAEGQAIGFNVCRDQQTPVKQLSCWSPVSGSFHDPAGFGRLVLSSTRPVTRQDPQAPGGAAEVVKVRLRIDWRALGLDPGKARLKAPAIGFFQGPAEFRPDEEIPIERAKGWLLVVE